jgi:hypothetical protein
VNGIGVGPMLRQISSNFSSCFSWLLTLNAFDAISVVDVITTNSFTGAVCGITIVRIAKHDAKLAGGPATSPLERALTHFSSPREPQA